MGRVIKVFNSYLMTAHEGGGIRVVKITARYLKNGDVLLEKDSAQIRKIVAFPSECDCVRFLKPVAKFEKKDKLRHG